MIFDTLIMLNIKFILGNFKKTFPHCKGEGGAYEDECLIIKIYFSKDGELLL